MIQKDGAEWDERVGGTRGWRGRKGLNEREKKRIREKTKIKKKMEWWD